MKIKVNFNEMGYNTTLSFEVNESDILFDLKKQIIQKIQFISIERMGLYYFDSQKNKVYLYNNSANIIQSIKNNTNVYLYDQGKQLDLALANTIEYSGPIVTFLLYIIYFKLYLQQDLSVMTIISIILSCFHYAKRVFESIVVHIHTKTMSLNMLILECVYYIGYYGIFCGYHVFTNEKEFHLVPDCFGIVLFFLSEINNFNCHIILRTIRLKNSNETQVPKGNLFKYVCCANYFWEVCSWISLTIVTRLYSVGFFACMGLAIMTAWALEKKKGYTIKYGKVCPPKAIIPFIL